MRVIRTVLSALVVLLFLTGEAQTPGLPLDPESREEASAAIFALEVDLELERARLERFLENFEEGEKRRIQLRAGISSLYERIAARMRAGEDAEDEDGLEFLEEELRVLEETETALRSTLRRLRERILEAREETGLLEEKLAVLRRSVPQERESLTGTWEVTYLPSGDRALFVLRQSGALVSGEYTQEGGWEGSLQGTLVKNKLALERIDSRQGPVSDLEGFVSPDLKSVRGTWQSRILSGGGPARGTWTGQKRETRGRGEGSAP